MIKIESIVNFPTDVLFRLGLWYGVYRIMVVAILLVIYSAQNSNLRFSYLGTAPFFLILFGYFFWILIQFIYYAGGIESRRQRALFNFALIDIIFFSLVSIYATNNYYVNSISLIMLFVINLVIPAPRVFILIALAVIGATLPVWASFFDFIKPNVGVGNIGMSVIGIITASILGRIVVSYLGQLQNKAVSQDLRLYNLDRVTQMVVNELTTGCMVFDNDYNLVYINQSSLKLLNLNNEIEGELNKSHADFMRQLKEPQIAEFRYTCNQTVVLSRKKILPLEHARSSWTFVFLEDESEINARVQRSKLQELGQLSASIAHEIRNPLATIVQANDLLTEANEIEKKRLIELISNQANRINHIIKSILMMARQKEVDRHSLFLIDVLNEMLYGELSHLRDVVKIEIDAGLTIYFDETHLRQVLVNLIENANRHNNWDKSSHILCKGYRHNNKVVLAVMDSGEGVIEPNKLFKPFYSTGSKGTGLGLYLCKILCETNKAYLEYQKLADGTCFNLVMDDAN